MSLSMVCFGHSIVEVEIKYRTLLEKLKYKVSFKLYL
jgi:hypothetical protein